MRPGSIFAMIALLTASAACAGGIPKVYDGDMALVFEFNGLGAMGMDTYAGGVGFRYFYYDEFAFRGSFNLAYWSWDDEGAGRMNIMLRSPELNEVSLAVGVDGNSRIWVVTNRRQLKDDEKVSLSVMVSNDGVSARMSQRTSGNTDITETDAYELEVFSPDGILLGKVPLTHFVDAMRIYGDRLYIVDKLRGMRVFEYRIVEK